jgi:hypothetical protein
MEDEYRSLLERKPAKGALQLVAVVNRQDADRLGLSGERQHPDLCAHPIATPGLGVALVREDPVEPRFEGIGVTERSELTPGGDECGLHRIIGTIGIAQDPERNRHAPIADRAREGVKGLPVAPLCAFDERSMHPTLPLLGPPWVDGHIREGSARAKGSIAAANRDQALIRATSL